MTSVDFMGSFVRRFGCTVQVGGREFDAMGRSAEKGGACAACGECSREYGHMGVAAEGVAIIKTVDGLHLSWTCPGCKRETVQDTTLMQASTDASGCVSDPLCFSCRPLHSGDATNE